MDNCGDATTYCCAECGEEGVVSLKACKSCMLVKYCNTKCQRNHWAKHKKSCKRRAAELRDEALFKDPPAKEDCPICFLPMPLKIITCVSLPPATISSVPIYDFAEANEELVDEHVEVYYPCCGKSVCIGCICSFHESGNNDKCPFCKAERTGKTNEEEVEGLMKRVEANDAAAIFILGNSYHKGLLGLPQDLTKAMELYTWAVNLGYSKAHCILGDIYEGVDLKKAKFHKEAAAMAGYEMARYNLGGMELRSRNMERAVKHWTIAASSGCFKSMHNLQVALKNGHVSTESIHSTLTAYNNSCAEMRSEARDSYIRLKINN